MKNSSKWTLIVGGSSGLGLATAHKLAREGYDLFILHRDRKADLQDIENEFNGIRSYGVALHSFNVDATNPLKIQEVVGSMSELLQGEKLSVLIHSVAKGNLKSLSNQDGASLNTSDFQHTIHAMGINLYDWTKAILSANLFAEDSRVIAFTSEGSSKAWEGYAAVSAAKATLESIVRSMALEFAAFGIKVNCIQAGITDTKSFRMIPNSTELKEQAIKRNPFNRLTTVEDVANAVYLLTLEEAKWINGTIVKVDGGESLR
ncbi:NAD(P)-dependent dehydrogenase (short-subunit alcohol dehydrogenase family) [Flagellimonas meridianipacifica]|uniref:NAD(P)-dependent dehydrogenase (Short-subunit alcohol dehydrogenase family) n=1 Tax=Flagellimonas meridianipacifica TaxID=1080225 RepID=A0A2T0MBG4_9FLAO|nr:NAD(P)-dependent dehydrogenase (short-subunit alcohol dehydrogenase family) [Allomuricauda pacifica]